MIKLHHTATAPGYISVKNKEGIKTPYKGRYGTGYTIRRNNPNSSRYCIIEYYIETEDEYE